MKINPPQPFNELPAPKISKYRRDSRSEEEFAADIKEATSIEAKLMKIYVEDLSKRTGKEYKIENNGADNSGALLDESQVNLNSDFILVSGESRHRIEIKFSRPKSPFFNIKVSQLKSYLKQDACMIMFNGIDSDEPAYTIMLPQNYQSYIDNGEKSKMWAKDCRRYKVKDLEWFPVAKIT